MGFLICFSLCTATLAFSSLKTEMLMVKGVPKAAPRAFLTSCCAGAVAALARVAEKGLVKLEPTWKGPHHHLGTIATSKAPRMWITSCAAPIPRLPTAPPKPPAEPSQPEGLRCSGSQAGEGANLP